MHELTNVQNDVLKEFHDLKRELAILKEKDRRNISRIELLKHKLQNFESAKEALGQSQLKYRNLFENSLIAMIRTNARTGEILYANPMVWEILGTDPRKGKSILNFYANPEDRANFLQDLMENGKVEDREVQLRKANGDTIWTSFSAVYYKEENIIEGVMMDISKIKDSLVALQKVNYELDNFVYHASHDLRSPLRSIMGLINLLRLEKTAAGRETCLEMIEGSIKRLDNLVIDLLQISKGSRANNPIEEISFVTEVNNSITNFYHVEDSNDIRIITKIYQPVDFTSDLTRVRIILNNLISNAIKYRSPNRDESYIIVEAVINEKNVVVTVEDNGEGIPKSKLPSIFDMFYRATDNNQGTGLGLYIVKNVVEKLGGKVGVESEQNRGTIFKVELPNQAA
jgi:PAS domain S-box-containing protein